MQEKTWQLLKKKDKESVAELYRRYGRRLFSFARNSWKLDEDDAWEIVYKTLYRVIETHSGYQFESEEKFASFVFTVFVNYLRNFVRDHKKFREQFSLIPIEQVAELTGKEEEAASPLMKLLVKELEHFEDWERILLLMRSQDADYASIAEYVGKPADQLKVYYQRLKKKLLERMNEKLSQSKKETHEDPGANY